MEGLRSFVIWVLSPLLELTYFIWNILQNIKWLLSQALKDSDPLVEVGEFCEYLDNFFSDGVERLPLERCSYGSLMENLKKDPSYAMVYLHDRGDSSCDNFCSSTLCNMEASKFFASLDCKLWACCLQSNEGRRVCRSLRARTFPFVALIGFKQSRPIMLLKMPGCQMSPNELMAKLKEVMNDNQIHLDEAKIDRRERDVNRSIRLAQDEEYRKSLANDKEKEKLKKDSEEEAKKMVIEENFKKLELGKLREEMRSKLLPEPDDAEEDVIKILIRFPSGIKRERKFVRKQSLEQLYIFVRTQEECPDDFEVAINFPRRQVPCDPRNSVCLPTFEEYKFGKTETLFVNET